MSKHIIHISRQFNSPTATNSMTIINRKIWKKILRTGHPGVLSSLHVRGESTRVSHAAIVSVHTKKYLWAAKCGGRRSDAGSNDVGSIDMFSGQLCSLCQTTTATATTKMGGREEEQTGKPMPHGLL
jgi:hypothetical protein